MFIIFFVPHQYHKHHSCHDKNEDLLLHGVVLSVDYLAENWRGIGIIHILSISWIWHKIVSVKSCFFIVKFKRFLMERFVMHR